MPTMPTDRQDLADSRQTGIHQLSSGDDEPLPITVTLRGRDNGQTQQNTLRGQVEFEIPEAGQLWIPLWLKAGVAPPDGGDQSEYATLLRSWTLAEDGVAYRVESSQGIGNGTTWSTLSFEVRLEGVETSASAQLKAINTPGAEDHLNEGKADESFVNLEIKEMKIESVEWKAHPGNDPLTANNHPYYDAGGSLAGQATDKGLRIFPDAKTPDEVDTPAAENRRIVDMEVEVKNFDKTGYDLWLVVIDVDDPSEGLREAELGPSTREKKGVGFQCG